jgi:hypothetical protein
MITDELAGFLESGICISIATRDAGLRPSGARVWAVTVDEDRCHVTAYVLEAAAGPILSDLGDNGQAALGFGRPSDHRAIQLKGVFAGARPAAPDEQPVVERQVAGMSDQLEGIGIPRAMFVNWAVWPAVAIRLRVEHIFDQTPGPRAGEPMRAGRA